MEYQKNTEEDTKASFQLVNACNDDHSTMDDSRKKLSNTHLPQYIYEASPDKGGAAQPPPTLYQRFRMWIHLLLWAGMTAYFIATMVISPIDDLLVLSFVYSFITLKLLFEHIPTEVVSGPIGTAWRFVIENTINRFPEKLKKILAVAIPVVCILAAVLIQPDSEVSTRWQRLNSCLGLVVLLAVLYGTSANRSMINWRIVIVGIILQFILSLLILKTSFGSAIFNWITKSAITFLSYSKEGAKFVFGNGITGVNNFAVSVLPAILFFTSFIQIMYYWGAMQWIIQKFAWVMVRLMDTSGSESVVAAASPFVAILY